MHNGAQTIQGIVDSISSACLIASLPAEPTEMMELQEFAAYQEAHRTQVIESLVRKYRLITDIMFKVVRVDIVDLTWVRLNHWWIHLQVHATRNSWVDLRSCYHTMRHGKSRFAML